YQNRDKIADALKGLQSKAGDGQPGGGGLGEILGNLGGMLGGGTGNGQGNVLTGGLGDLLDTFRGAGQAETADSWVTPGVPTKGLTPQEVEQAVGSNNLDELSRRT